MGNKQLIYMKNSSYICIPNTACSCPVEQGICVAICFCVWRGWQPFGLEKKKMSLKANRITVEPTAL